MTDDAIVNEIRQVRERIWEECGGSLAAYMERMREVSARYADRVVTKDEFDKERTRSPAKVTR
jgi:hypothetical protein